jgi:phage N-6-adenine-methyltransferase
LFSALDSEFAFTVDGAASAANALLPWYWSAEQDALAQSWRGERVFVNPPYDHRALSGFAGKAWRETRAPGTLAVLLVPAKVDQAWWAAWAILSEVRFVRGRVRFQGALGTAAFPVAVLVFERGRPASMRSWPVERSLLETEEDAR